MLCGVALCVRRGLSAWELEGPFGRGGEGQASPIEAQLNRAKIACDSKSKGLRASDGPLAANQQQAAEVRLR